MSSDRSIVLSELTADARVLDLEAFTRRHGAHFLVRSSIDGPLREPPRLSEGDWDKPTKRVMRTELAMPVIAPESPRPGDGFFVYPLRKRRGAGPVTVGRTPNNDVCIGDASLSKSHARFTVSEDGALRLLDLTSRNGTMIGDRRLEPDVEYEIPFGKTVTFGSVRLTYMPVAQLVEFVVFMT